MRWKPQKRGQDFAVNPMLWTEKIYAFENPNRSVNI